MWSYKLFSLSCLANLFVHKHSGATSETAVYCLTESGKFSCLHFSLSSYCLTNHWSSKVKPKLSLIRSTHDKCHCQKMVTNVDSCSQRPRWRLQMPQRQFSVIEDKKHRKCSLLRSSFWRISNRSYQNNIEN